MNDHQKTILSVCVAIIIFYIGLICISLMSNAYKNKSLINIKKQLNQQSIRGTRGEGVLKMKTNALLIQTLKTLREDTEMALDNKWDKSDRGFKHQIILINQILDKIKENQTNENNN